MKKVVLRNFTKFTGKHLCQSLFFNKVPGLGLQLYLKRDSGTGVSFFTEHLWATASAFLHKDLICY